jgi:hypothetical protein
MKTKKTIKGVFYLEEKVKKESKPKKITKAEQKSIENQKWIEMCEYVKLEILQYPPEMKYPRPLALRLRGLLNGKFMANKTTKPLASYTIEQVLMTFKACKYDILRGFSNNVFKDENHRVNYMMVAIEANINDIVLRMRNAEKSKEKVESMELDNIVNEGVEYKDKVIKDDSRSKVADKLKELW